MVRSMAVFLPGGFLVLPSVGHGMVKKPFSGLYSNSPKPKGDVPPQESIKCRSSFNFEIGLFEADIAEKFADEPE
jgi:hypothetical protein